MAVLATDEVEVYVKHAKERRDRLRSNEVTASTKFDDMMTKHQRGPRV